VHRMLSLSERLPRHPGPRGEQAPVRGTAFFVRLAELEMHPLDTLDRRNYIREDMGIGLCNITKCCTEVCPEDIHITDNAIIPLKEAHRRRPLRPGRVARAQDHGPAGAPGAAEARKHTGAAHAQPAAPATPEPVTLPEFLSEGWFEALAAALARLPVEEITADAPDAGLALGQLITEVPARQEGRTARSASRSCSAEMAPRCSCGIRLNRPM